jgi:HSP20 family molecular chaperone IbpA
LIEPQESTMTQNVSPTIQSGPILAPRVDVFEDETGLTLLADLPGVPKDKLAIDIDGDTLRIEGEVAARRGAAPALHSEFQAARYKRAFTLSRELDSARVQAESVNGVLKLRIPKRERPQPRKVDIVTH